MAFVNSTADTLGHVVMSATYGGVSTPALQLASFFSCMRDETAPEARQDAHTQKNMSCNTTCYKRDTCNTK
eukprot:6175871-Pleurochrysis_carterae.AAC.1